MLYLGFGHSYTFLSAQKCKNIVPAGYQYDYDYFNQFPQTVSGIIEVKVYVHVLRNAQGLGGLTEYEATNSIASPHEIKLKKYSYSVHPNPTNGIFYVNSLSDKSNITSIKVYNSKGSLLIDDEMKHSLSVDLGHYSSGLYLIKLVDLVTHKAETHKVIVR